MSCLEFLKPEKVEPEILYCHFFLYVLLCTINTVVFIYSDLHPSYLSKSRVFLQHFQKVNPLVYELYISYSHRGTVERNQGEPLNETNRFRAVNENPVR